MHWCVASPRRPAALALPFLPYPALSLSLPSPVFISRCAEELGKHFPLQHLDTPLGGSIPEGEMWNFDAYGQRMAKLDAEAAADIKAAEEARAAMGAEQAALSAEFEAHVTVM